MSDDDELLSSSNSPSSDKADDGKDDVEKTKISCLEVPNLKMTKDRCPKSRLLLRLERPPRWMPRWAEGRSGQSRVETRRNVIEAEEGATRNEPCKNNERHSGNQEENRQICKETKQGTKKKRQRE